MVFTLLETVKNATFSQATPNIIEPDILATRVKENCNPNITSIHNIPGALRVQSPESNLIPHMQDRASQNNFWVHRL